MASCIVICRTSRVESFQGILTRLNGNHTLTVGSDQYWPAVHFLRDVRDDYLNNTNLLSQWETKETRGVRGMFGHSVNFSICGVCMKHYSSSFYGYDAIHLALFTEAFHYKPQ